MICRYHRSLQARQITSRRVSSSIKDTMVTGEDGWHAREGDSQLCRSMCVLVSVVNTNTKYGYQKRLIKNGVTVFCLEKITSKPRAQF